MKNMKIAAKLILSFSIVALLALVVGLVGIYGMRTIDASYTDAYIKQTKPLPDMAKILEYSQRLRVQFRNIIIFEDNPEMLASTEADIIDRSSKFDAYLDAYDATIVNDEARKLFDEARKIWNDTYKPALNKALADAKADVPVSELIASMNSVTDASNTMVDNFSRCMDIKIEAADKNSDANTVTANNMLYLSIAIVVVAVIVAMILGIYVSRIISAPTKLLSDTMKELVATGNFRISGDRKTRLDEFARYKDETGVTAKGFEDLLGMINEKCSTLETVANGDLTANVALRSDADTIGVSLSLMVDNLNKMFTEINSSSNQVSTGSVQIADGAQLLAQGATEQSATVEELSASITQISEQTKLNAGTANEARELGESIKVSAERGSQQMGQMMQAVQEINESSKSIGKVIKIIDDIAFQTNILALNAAVEAARAGQHGKGFAVVADEVRSLAAKSAEAAKNTNELIETSIQKAEQGAAISQETSESLNKIVEGILRTSELISDIAKSSSEQSIAVSQVSEGIDQVSQVVQQNSATAEQSAAASEEMSGQATLLQQLISQFKIKEGAVYGQPSMKVTPVAPVSSPSSTGYALSGGDKY